MHLVLSIVVAWLIINALIFLWRLVRTMPFMACFLAAGVIWIVAAKVFE